MRNDPLPAPIEARPLDIDLPLASSVALQRLIDEIRQSELEPLPDTTLYNRTYHRHNR